MDERRQLQVWLGPLRPLHVLPDANVEHLCEEIALAPEVGIQSTGGDPQACREVPD
jgi:hypothetical protein